MSARVAPDSRLTRRQHRHLISEYHSSTAPDHTSEGHGHPPDCTPAVSARHAAPIANLRSRLRLHAINSATPLQPTISARRHAFTPSQAPPAATAHVPSAVKRNRLQSPAARSPEVWRREQPKAPLQEPSVIPPRKGRITSMYADGQVKPQPTTTQGTGSGPQRGLTRSPAQDLSEGDP
jgi:hypothetical protein